MFYRDTKEYLNCTEQLKFYYSKRLQTILSNFPLSNGHLYWPIRKLTNKSRGHSLKSYFDQGHKGIIQQH